MAPKKKAVRKDGQALDARERRFAIEYAGGTSATEAARLAGYSEATARHACDWVRKSTHKSAAKKYKTHVVAFVEGLQEAHQKKADIDTNRLLELLMARATIPAFALVKKGLEENEDGKLVEINVPKTFEELTADEALLVQYVGKHGAGYPTITLRDRANAGSEIARIIGAYKDAPGYVFPPELMAVLRSGQVSADALRMLACGVIPGEE